jgi:hypothetical protein
VGLGVAECDVNRLLFDLERLRLEADNPELQTFYFQIRDNKLLIIRSRSSTRSDGAFAPMED